MAADRFSPTLFRRVGGSLDLEHRDFWTRPGGVRESLPRVSLFRSTDLLNLRLSFVGLVIDQTPDGPVLRRGDDAETGFLRVILGGQHLHEEAFFEVSNVPVKSAGSGDGRPDDPDAASEPEIPTAPPVRTRISGASRLVFVVRDERIPFARDALLTALATLPLSTVPHAVRRARPNLVLRPEFGLNDLVRLDGQPGLQVRRSGAILAATRTLSSAATVLARFGSEAAASALLAAHDATGTFRLGEDSEARLNELVAQRLVHVDLRPPAPAEPSPTETALELPWRLQLSPHPGAGFVHATGPATSPEGRVELWHTRLGTRTESGVDDRPRDDRTVRAVWARDFDETPGFTFHEGPQENAALEFPSADQSVADVPRWRSALSSRDRMMLVHETSNFRLAGGNGVAYEPPSVEVDRLMLSTLGGWLASSFETAVPPGNTTIQEWVHRAALGRDSYVKVVYAGFLLPFLHPASLVKVTERKIKNGVAHLFQRMYVVVRDPVHTFGATGYRVPEDLDTGQQIDLAMPFTSVQMLTLSTPDLDEPDDLSAPDSAGGPDLSVPGLMFTPEVGGVPFRFRMLGLDLVGRSVEFDGPVVFAEFDHNANDVQLERTLQAYRRAVPRFDVRGQKVAYAASAAADDTSLSTSSLTFNLVSTPKMRADRPPSRARMEPMLRAARVVVPAMSVLAGADAGSNVRYPDAYLATRFAGNPAEVFLQMTDDAGNPAVKVTSPLSFTAQSDRSGGFVAPSLDVTALSRVLGPVGAPVDSFFSGAAAFDIGQYFPSAAKLFGLVPLADLVPKVAFTPAALPRFVAQSLDAATLFGTNLEQLIDLNGRLSTLPAAATLAGPLQAAADAAATALDAVAALTSSTGAATAQAKVDAVAAALAQLQADTANLLGAIGAAPDLLRADRESLAATLTRVGDQLGRPDDLLGAFVQLAGGGRLPELARARLDWTTDLMPWPAAPNSIFVPRGTGRLTLAVDVQPPTSPGAPPNALVSCSISPFELRLIGDVTVITLAFEKLEFSSVPGAKTDVNVVFSEPGGVTFGGPLSFVETLREIIPFDGFSDPPYLDVSPAGIRAGFDLALPTIAMGVFALSNVTFSAAFEVPFIGESIAVRFGFSSRENPFRLQIAFFAGGGFFAITITPKEVRELEAALEFGAAVALNFGVASGSVSVMAGIYFRLRTQGGETNAQLTGYFRARGEVDVLGLITASIEIYLSLTYETATNKAVGRASISVEVSVCMLSFSVKISCEKKFAGSAGDPSFADVMGLHPAALPGSIRPWDDYCDAFAG